METKIFIFAGKAETGKNKAALLLKEIYENKKVINISYASYLKEYAKNILNWDGNEDNKPRNFLQQIGIEIVNKKIDDKMLIRRIIEDIKVYSHYFDIISISDARFKEEIEDIKKEFKNVKVIHILSDENKLTEEQKNHITETALDNYNGYDYEIFNNKIESDLKEKLKHIIDEVENYE